MIQAMLMNFMTQAHVFVRTQVLKEVHRLSHHSHYLHNVLAASFKYRIITSLPQGIQSDHISDYAQSRINRPKASRTS